MDYNTLSLLCCFLSSYILLDHVRHKFTTKNQIKYNNFADKRAICSVPNFMDVASNLVFVSGGLYHYDKPLFAFFSILVAIGSSYFHLNPTMDTLIWDRLPMMLLMSKLLSLKLNMSLMYSLAIYIFSTVSTVYWYYSSNLVPYCTFQLAPIIFFLIHEEYNMRMCVGWYMIAKICEDYDKKIFDFTGEVISGHTLKHLAAGIAIFFI